MTFGDIVRRIFEKALAIARERLLAKYGDKLDAYVGARDYVTRDDVEQAIVALRFEQMEISVQQLDALRALGVLELEAAKQRARENAEYVETEIIERDGSEEFRPAFPRSRK